MRVKELIKRLRECEPDAIVCIDGGAPVAVEQMSGGYDGSHYEILNHTWDCPCYDCPPDCEDSDCNHADGPCVCKEEVYIIDDSEPWKVDIRVETLRDYLRKGPNKKVEVRNKSPHRKSRWEFLVKELRENNQISSDKFNKTFSECRRFRDYPWYKKAWLTLKGEGKPEY